MTCCWIHWVSVKLLLILTEYTEHKRTFWFHTEYTKNISETARNAVNMSFDISTRIFSCLHHYLHHPTKSSEQSWTFLASGGHSLLLYRYTNTLNKFSLTFLSFTKASKRRRKIHVKISFINVCGRLSFHFISSHVVLLFVRHILSFYA